MENQLKAVYHTYPIIMEEEKPENPEEAEVKMLDFLKDYPEEDPQWIRNYIHKYASHWKKKIIQSIEDYQDKDRFLNDFLKWKKREQTKVSV